MSEIRVIDLIEVVKGEYEIHGDQNRTFIKVSPLGMESEDSLVWISSDHDDKECIIQETRASVVLCDRSLLTYDLPNDKSFLLVDDPRLVFARILRTFFRTELGTGTDSSAVVHPQASIGKDSWIGPLTIIGHSSIGTNCQIYGNVTIYDDVEIGNNVAIHSGTVLGA